MNKKEIISGWNPVKRFLSPVIAKLPPLFWPTTKAKALIAEGRSMEAFNVLNNKHSPSALFLKRKLREDYTLNILECIEKSKKEKTPCRPSELKECKTLNDFALFFGTDKSSEYHDLCDIYEEFLKKFRETEFNLFEYGVLYFASLNMWGAYFPTAHIFGVDPWQEQYTNNIHNKNITYIKHDAYDKEFMNNIFKKFPPSIIIDDATHYYSHQISGFEFSFPFLVSGGLYIVEDIETSFGEFRYGIWNDQEKDAASYFAQIALLVNGDMENDSHNLLESVTEKQKKICSSIKWISFIKNSVIIAKK